MGIEFCSTSSQWRSLHAVIQGNGYVRAAHLNMSGDYGGPSEQIRPLHATEHFLRFGQAATRGEHANELIAEENIAESASQNPGIDLSTCVDVFEAGTSLEEGREDFSGGGEGKAFHVMGEKKRVGEGSRRAEIPEIEQEEII
jgi:hypothetical protein